MAPLKYLVVSPKLKHTATVVFLHGLGDSGAGWELVAREVGASPDLGHVKWVLPHARRNPVTINGGMSIPSWYDMYSLTEMGLAPEDEKGLLESARSINEIITSEIDSGIEASRIVLGGFSQGGAVTLLTGLTTERKLAGLVVMSSYLPLNGKIKSMMSDHARELPIFMAHGTADPVIPFKIAQASYMHMNNELGLPAVEAGKTAGVGVRFEQYKGMGHGVDSGELRDLSEWLKNVIHGGN